MVTQIQKDHLEKNAISDDRKRAVAAYLKEPTSKNIAILKELGISDKSIKEIQKKADMSKVDRALDGLPKKPKTARDIELDRTVRQVSSFK